MRARPRLNSWSPKFALTWALVNTFLLAMVVGVFLLLSADGGLRETNATGSQAGSRRYDVGDAPPIGGGHCFDARTEALLFGGALGGASLFFALLALVVDPQVGALSCRRKTSFCSDRYGSLFDRPAKIQVPYQLHTTYIHANITYH